MISQITKNNDFIGTLIAPPGTSAESCDINTTLLNLVMIDQFSGTRNEDVASHLNTFMELCDMQKKKDVDKDQFAGTPNEDVASHLKMM